MIFHPCVPGTGKVVDAVVSSAGDALYINGVTPFVYDNTKATEAARTSAVKNAKAKATSYAKLLGVKIGKIIYLQESSVVFTKISYVL